MIAEYKAAPEFTSLAAATKKTYQRAIEHIAPLGPVPIRDIKRRHILKRRDDLREKPAIANQVLAVFSVLLKFAVDREYIEHSPAHRIRAYKLGEHRRWSRAEIDHALATLREPLRRAVLLGLYTGQRVGDVVRMRWSDYDGRAIQVVQQKTGARLWIPAHAELRDELDRWDRTAVTILTNLRGQPWTAATFSTVISEAFRADPKLGGAVYHGLRKSAAAMLAEAGCSVHEIAAITGHATIAMLQHYTREAEQKVRAEAAMGRVVSFTGKRGEKA